jgi:hypothetical protein
MKCLEPARPCLKNKVKQKRKDKKRREQKRKEKDVSIYVDFCRIK